MRITVLAALIGCSLAGGACAASPTLFDLRFALSVDGRLVGQPRLLVEPGAPSEISVADPDGGGYRLEVHADAPPTPTDPPSILLSTVLHTRVGDAWQVVGEPTLQIALDGHAASIQVGPAGDAPARYRIEIAATVAGDATPMEPATKR